MMLQGVTSARIIVGSVTQMMLIQSENLFLLRHAEAHMRASTAIIHGTAFGDAEFRQMSQAKAKLIWSPESNLRLYDQTTNIPLALKYEIPVSLGVDWNASGSDNLFDELRVASQVNSELFQGAIPPKDWIRMITANPAQALALDDQIGELTEMRKADIAVLRLNDPDPSQSLLKTHLQDVLMVWVGGKLLYGQESILQKVKKNTCEPLLVHGSKKRVCVSSSNVHVPKSDETLAIIRQKLQAAYPGLAPLVP